MIQEGTKAKDAETGLADQDFADLPDRSSRAEDRVSSALAALTDRVETAAVPSLPDSPGMLLAASMLKSETQHRARTRGCQTLGLRFGPDDPDLPQSEPGRASSPESAGDRQAP